MTPIVPQVPTPAPVLALQAWLFELSLPGKNISVLRPRPPVQAPQVKIFAKSISGDYVSFLRPIPLILDLQA